MGHVILPCGTSVWVNELGGSVNLSTLIHDMKDEDYTLSYRISMIGALGKLEKFATDAIPFLNDLLKNKDATGDEKLLADAANQAIKKIQDGNNRSSVVHNHSSVVHNHCSGNTQTTKKPEVQQVTFAELPETKTLHDGLRVYCACNFCDKTTIHNAYHRRFADRLAGKHYCNFCIRNDYYQQFSKNIMILTYRGIIGYYYYAYYIVPKSSSMFTSDIVDYVDLHVKAGLQNPLFRYDYETFCWFIDFNKIGKTKRKMPIESVLATITEQLASFNLYENVKDCSPSKLYKKYADAVMEFYQHRTRTNGDRSFAPTLWGCDIPTRCSAGTRPIPVDALSGFLPSSLTDSTYRKGKGY